MFRLLLIVIVLQGCVFFEQPKRIGPSWYLVKPSDTLYGIAWRYQIDFKVLAQWNHLKKPYTIAPGQYIRLEAPNSVAGLPNNPKKSSHNRAIVKHKKIKLNNLQDKPILWQWPVKGKVLNRFNFNDINKRGIDIASKVRQPIVTVASGKVVYSGNGLAGYKNLIIIKHNETFLSAYSQNKNLLVKEGDFVSKGMKIADMGQADKIGYILKFQIRKNGKPVDPFLYLPKQ